MQTLATFEFSLPKKATLLEYRPTSLRFCKFTMSMLSVFCILKLPRATSGGQIRVREIFCKMSYPTMTARPHPLQVDSTALRITPVFPVHSKAKSTPPVQMLTTCVLFQTDRWWSTAARVMDSTGLPSVSRSKPYELIIHLKSSHFNASWHPMPAHFLNCVCYIGNPRRKVYKMW